MHPTAATPGCLSFVLCAVPIRWVLQKETRSLEVLHGQSDLSSWCAGPGFARRWTDRGLLNTQFSAQPPLPAIQHHI